MRLGDLVHGATFVPMPETAVDEDTGAESHDGQVGRARQSLGMDAITEAMTEEKAPHEHLWSRVLRPDSAHTITALFGCHLICHKPLQFSTINYQLPLFLRHIFPIPSGHVIQLLLRIHAFADTDSLEVSAPEILEEFVILTQHLVIEFAIVEVEGQRILILERDARHLLLVVVEAISALGIVEEPGLGAKAVLEVMHHQRQHIVVGRHHTQIRSILRLLKAYELHHPQSLMHHLSEDVRHSQHVWIGEVPFDASCSFCLSEHLTYILE